MLDKVFPGDDGGDDVGTMGSMSSSPISNSTYLIPHFGGMKFGTKAICVRVRSLWGRNMQNRNDDPTEILHDDSLRTTRLNLALRTSYDDFLELVTRSGPHRQAVDADDDVAG